MLVVVVVVVVVVLMWLPLACSMLHIGVCSGRQGKVRAGTLVMVVMAARRRGGAAVAAQPVPLVVTA